MIYLSVAFSILSTVLLMGLVFLIWSPYRKTTDLSSIPWIFAWLLASLIWNFFAGRLPIAIRFLATSIPDGATWAEALSVALVFVYSLSSLLLGFMIACNAAHLLAAKGKLPPFLAFLKRCHAWQPIYGIVLLALKFLPGLIFLLPQALIKS